MLCGTEQVHGHGEEIVTDLECPHCSATFGFEHDDRIVRLSAKPALLESQGDDVSLYYYECPKCHGNWASEQVLISMLEQSSSRMSKIEPEERLRNIEDRAYFKCPKNDCGEMLSRFLWTRIIKRQFAGVSFPVVDKCSGCGGIWLDNGELDWLLEMGTRALPSEHHLSKKIPEGMDEPKKQTDDGIPKNLDGGHQPTAIADALSGCGAAGEAVELGIQAVDLLSSSGAVDI